jgi:hypothetical protein
MSEAAVLERPEADTSLSTPRFIRVAANLRRLWRVWSVLDGSSVNYSAHGAYGWKDSQTRIAIIEVHGSAQDVSRVLNEFERFRFKALPFGSKDEALITGFGTPQPVDDERRLADAEAEKSHQKGLLKPRRPGSDDRDDGLAGV